MDKKYLRSLPIEQAEPEFLTMAAENRKMDWLLTASKTDEILQITAYNAKKLRERDTSPTYRCFFAEADYITQDLRTEKTKWLTGMMTSIFSQYWYGSWDYKVRRYTHDRLVFVNDIDSRVARDHFDKENGHPTWTVWTCISHWQNEIRDKKTDDRHFRELQHTRDMMKLVPELPEDFDNWINEYAMRDKRYLVYEGGRTKAMRTACCTHCGKLMRIDPTNVELRMNEWGECPQCGSAVKMVPIKRFAQGKHDQKGAAIIQRLGEESLLVRYFSVAYSFYKDELLGTVKKECHVLETCREFLSGSGKNRKKESFEFAVYKQRGMEQWCPDVGAVECGEAVLYTKGLRETLAGTDWRYSGLDAFQEREGCRMIPLWRYLDCYPENKELETLAKTGLTTLASELVRDPWVWRANGGKQRRGIPKDLYTLNNEHRRVLRDLNGGSSMIGVLRELELCKNTENTAAVTAYIKAFGSTRQLITDLTELNIKLSKFTRYAMKQTRSSRRISELKQREKISNFVHDWKDYIGWSRKLGYNMRDEYVLMPPDFQKAHDRLMEEAKRKEDERLRRQKARIRTRVNAILKQMLERDEQTPLQMRTKNLMIVVPASADEIRAEGQILHHCVATYVERVARGETLILFVRKTDKPDEPYFTMEWRDDRVIQCRGNRNCDMPADVKAFVTAFEKKMQEETVEKRQRQRVKVS